MTPIDPTTPLSATLQAQEWNQVRYWLGKHPYEEVAHLIAKIIEQVQAAAGQGPERMPPQPPLANGADSHVRD